MYLELGRINRGQINRFWNEWHCRLWRLSLRRRAGDDRAVRFVEREVGKAGPLSLEPVARHDCYGAIALGLPRAQRQPSHVRSVLPDPRSWLSDTLIGFDLFRKPSLV